MKLLSHKFEENIFKCAEAMHKIFIEKVPDGPEYKYWSQIEKSSSKKTYELYAEVKKLGDLENLKKYLHHDNLFVRYLTSGFLSLDYPEEVKGVLFELIESNVPIVVFHSKNRLENEFGIDLWGDL